MEFASDSDLVLKYNFFDVLSYRRNVEIFTRCIDIVDQVDLSQMLIHDKPVSYLDLAAKPCLRNMRGDHANFEAIRNLPPACAEYLIAECRTPSSLEKMLTHVFHYRQMRFMENTIDRVNLGKIWYVRYSYRFNRRLPWMLREEWIDCFRRMLNIHRLLQIKGIVQANYKLWMRQLTLRIRDPALTVEFIDTVMGNDRRLKSIAFFLLPPECLEYLLSHAKVMRFDFWGLWRGIGDTSAIMNPVSNYIYNGLNLLAQILLIYGFPHPPVVENYNIFPTGFLRNRSVFGLLTWYIPRYKHVEFKMRLGLVRPRIMAYIVLAFMGREYLSISSKNTLVALMRSVPVPYILPSEIIDELRPFFFENLDHILVRICRRYLAANIFGHNEPLTDLKPRTLKHLSRCTVRKALADSFSLPETIYTLDVPRTVKEYLRLED